MMCGQPDETVQETLKSCQRQKVHCAAHPAALLMDDVITGYETNRGDIVSEI
jgi:hypothetical protein